MIFLVMIFLTMVFLTMAFLTMAFLTMLFVGGQPSQFPGEKKALRSSPGWSTRSL
jgi:hypothetical protein